MAASVTQLRLTAFERRVLEQLSERHDRHSRKAVGLLALSNGLTRAEAAEKAGVKAPTVSRWKTAFQQHRLQIFPETILDVSGGAQVSTGGGERLGSDRAAVSPVLLPPADIPARLNGLLPDDTAIAAAKKILGFHFSTMLAHQAGTIAGEDIEELHDMRVATRRMRSGLRLFRNNLNRTETRPVLKGLRTTGRALGKVRDLDVFWQKTSSYLDGGAGLAADDLDLVRLAWERQRGKARQRMIEYLEGRKYKKFKKSFRKFLQLPETALSSPAGRRPAPVLLRHVAPTMIVDRLMNLLAYGPLLEEQPASFTLLHELRIAGKRLRYALEFFEEILAPEAAALISDLKIVQDQLGDLQDAVVASEWLNELLDTAVRIPNRQAAKPKRQKQISGLQSYLITRRTEREQLRQGFLVLWSDFGQHAFIRVFQKNLGLP